MAKLTPEARRFRRWLTDTFDVQGCDALLDQLVGDFNELVLLRERARLAREAGDDTLYLKYTAAITKMTASFVRTWKCAGLAGVELPPEVRASAQRR
jgi:hypothetical protein